VVVANIPAAYSVFVFAFSAHGIFPDLEASMERPELFGPVVASVFASNICVKAIFSVLGYCAFGAATAPVLTSNFPALPRLVISILIAANTYLSFPLPLVPVFNTLRGFQPDASRARLAVQRTCVVLVCGVVAVAVPDFTIAMGFMGSLTLALLTFIFPTVFYLKLHGAGMSSAGKAATCFVTIMGALGGAAGLASNIALVSGGGGAAPMPTNGSSLL
jgi:vesicular inhibitory amino acid transporter